MNPSQVKKVSRRPRQVKPPQQTDLTDPTQEQTTMPHSKALLRLHQKHIEIIANILFEQNRQLLKEIAEDLRLPENELYDKFLFNRQKFYDEITTLYS